MTDQHSIDRNATTRAIARLSCPLLITSMLVLSACSRGPLDAQAPATSPKSTAAAAPAEPAAPAATPKATGTRPAVEFSTLVGRWVRPDGGYVVMIESVGADGRLEASYANPNPLPFSMAEVTRDGDEIRVFLELTAGGYSGSTYTLTFDPVRDGLRGDYFQAVAQQHYDVYFERVE